MTSPIELDGDVFYASDAPLELTNIGVLLVSASGKRRWVQRLVSAAPVYKRTWALTFDSVGEITRQAIRAKAALNTTFTYSDQNGEDFTVQCEADAYSDSVAFIAGNGDLYYDVKLTLHEE